MDQQMVTLVWIGVALLVVVGVAVWAMRRRQRERLKQHFGPEYERAVRETGAPARADAVLAQRERRVAALDIRPLTSDQRDRFVDNWTQVQAQFVDDPPGAVTEADRLVGEVLEARGYPVGDFEQRAADVSVRHPHVVENYRAARAIAVRHSRGEAATEDLRQAMVHYRALFSDLLESEEPAAEQARRRHAS